MADAKTSDASAAKAPAYDPARVYRVRLARNVEYPAGSGMRFSPADAHHISGKMLNEIAPDAVADAQLV